MAEEAGEEPAVAAIKVKQTSLEKLDKVWTDPAPFFVYRADAALDGPADSLLADAQNQSAGEAARFAVVGKDGTVHVGQAASVEEFIAAVGDRAVVTHDLKAQLERSDAPVPKIDHDTRIAAYLIDSARRQYAIREMAIELGVKPGGG